MGKAASQKSLDAWTRQRWRDSQDVKEEMKRERTGGSKPKSKPKKKKKKGLYAPEAELRRDLSNIKGRRKVARSEAVKARATASGKQFAKHGYHKGKKRGS